MTLDYVLNLVRKAEEQQRRVVVTWRGPSGIEKFRATGYPHARVKANGKIFILLDQPARLIGRQDGHVLIPRDTILDIHLEEDRDVMKEMGLKP